MMFLSWRQPTASHMSQNIFMIVPSGISIRCAMVLFTNSRTLPASNNVQINTWEFNEKVAKNARLELSKN